SMQYTDIPPTF
nr:immunoglobulin light chain junction region [Macaca mulatta]